MNTAIILAAGKSSRMKSHINKQYIEILGKPILVYTLDVFESNELIDEIIVVVSKEEYEFFKAKVLAKFEYKKVSKIIIGGNERQQSVYNALSEISPKSNIVLIHDGARPFITNDIVNSCIEATKQYKAVSTGMPSKDTIKILDSCGFVSHTPKRQDVWITQTPQSFEINTIKKAHEYASKLKLTATDDAMLVEIMGEKVKMIEGSYENIKITTPEDLITANGILKHRNNIT